MNYKIKYLSYKKKYINLRNQYGGLDSIEEYMNEAIDDAIKEYMNEEIIDLGKKNLESAFLAENFVRFEILLDRIISDSLNFKCNDYIEQEWDNDIDDYLKKNENNFVIKYPNANNYECNSLDYLKSSYKLTSDPDQYQFFYQCKDYDPTAYLPKEENLIRENKFIKLGSVNYFVKKPDWIFEGKPPGSRIFNLVKHEELQYFASNHLADRINNLVIGADHCNQKQPIQTYKLEEYENLNNIISNIVHFILDNWNESEECTQIFLTLLKYPKINLNLQNEYGYSPLMICCLKNIKIGVLKLLEKNVKLEFLTSQEKDGIPIYKDAYDIAVLKNNSEIVINILEELVKVNELNFPLIYKIKDIPNNDNLVNLEVYYNISKLKTLQIVKQSKDKIKKDSFKMFKKTYISTLEINSNDPELKFIRNEIHGKVYNDKQNLVSLKFYNYLTEQHNVIKEFKIHRYLNAHDITCKIFNINSIIFNTEINSQTENLNLFMVAVDTVTSNLTIFLKNYYNEIKEDQSDIMNYINNRIYDKLGLLLDLKYTCSYWKPDNILIKVINDNLKLATEEEIKDIIKKKDFNKIKIYLNDITYSFCCIGDCIPNENFEDISTIFLGIYCLSIYCRYHIENKGNKLNLLDQKILQYEDELYTFLIVKGEKYTENIIAKYLTHSALRVSIINITKYFYTQMFSFFTLETKIDLRLIYKYELYFDKLESKHEIEIGKYQDDYPLLNSNGVINVLDRICKNIRKKIEYESEIIFGKGYENLISAILKKEINRLESLLNRIDVNIYESKSGEIELEPIHVAILDFDAIPKSKKIIDILL